MSEYTWMVLRKKDGKLMMYNHVKRNCEDWIREMSEVYDFELELKLLSVRSKQYIKEEE